MAEKSIQQQLSTLIKDERQQAYDQGFQDGFSAAIAQLQKTLPTISKTAPKRRGRPPKSAAPPARRGRPPKSRTAKKRARRGQVRSFVTEAVSKLSKKGAGATAIKNQASALAGAELSINSVRASLTALLKSGQVGKTGPNWHPVAKKTRKPSKASSK